MAPSDKNQGGKPIWQPEKHKSASKNYGMAKPVADFVGKILDPVIAQKAGMDMNLISAWEEIVGSEHAEYTQPEKLSWPRKAHEDDPFKPATLIVACDGARAVFFQHEAQQIIERVNAFLGFGAVDRMKIVQRPILRKMRRQKKQAMKLPEELAQKLDRSLENVEDEKLRASLEKLGQGVFSEGSSLKKDNGP